MKPINCGACRREVVRRDNRDRIKYWWNDKKEVWYWKPAKLPILRRTQRIHYHTGLLRLITVWKCKCGYLNEIDPETINTKVNGTRIQIGTMDHS